MLANKNQDPAGKTAFTGSFDALELAIYKVGFISLSRDLGGKSDKFVTG